MSMGGISPAFRLQFLQDVLINPVEQAISVWLTLICNGHLSEYVQSRVEAKSHNTEAVVSKVQVYGLTDESSQAMGKVNVVADHGNITFTTRLAQAHPDLERPESTRGLHALVTIANR